MATVECTMQSTGLVENCAACEQRIQRGQTMYAVVLSSGANFGWVCPSCHNRWIRTGTPFDDAREAGEGGEQ